MTEIDAPPAGYDPISEEDVSAPVAALNGRIVAWEEGAARMEAEITPLFINRTGALHGGAHAILLDTAASYAGCFCPYPGRYRRCVTISLSINYIGSSRDGELYVDAKRTGGGRRLFFADAVLTGADGSVLATATGSFRYIGEGGSLFGDPRPAVESDR